MLRHGWGGVGWYDNVNRGKLGVLKVHTGKIDSCWNLAKKFLPTQPDPLAHLDADAMLALVNEEGPEQGNSFSNHQFSRAMLVSGRVPQNKV